MFQLHCSRGLCLALVFAASVMLIPCICADEESDAPALTIGSKAPELNVEHWLSDGHGRFKPVTSFEPGKVYIVEFWATWCGPCIASMPHLAETQERLAKKDVQIVSISDEDLETVEKFLKRPVRKAPAKPANGDAKEGEEAEKEQTYADLTAAYCLTTDPDRSVAADYMEAAEQRGIPTCFIVGKSGLVEWIGHPMAMDAPLDKVIADSWDRDKFLADFRKQQARDRMMSKISALMRKQDIEGALAVVENARKASEADEQMLAILNRLEVQIRVSPAIRKIQTGEAQEGLEELQTVLKTVPEELKLQIRMNAYQALLASDSHDQAAQLLTDMAGAVKFEAMVLNNLAWSAYEAVREKKDAASSPLAKAATLAAEKAVDADPKNGMILDTLAHLVYLDGNLDRALELQIRATEDQTAVQSGVGADITAFLDELKKAKKNEGK